MEIPTHIQLLLELHDLERRNDGIDTKERCGYVEGLLDPTLVKRYHAVRKKRTTGIAILKDRTCEGCRMVFPESHEVFRYGTFVHTCEFCGRLLIVLETSPQNETPPGEPDKDAAPSEGDEGFQEDEDTDDAETDDETPKKVSKGITSGPAAQRGGNSSVRSLDSDPTYDEILWEMLRDSDPDGEETEEEE